MRPRLDVPVRLPLALALAPLALLTTGCISVQHLDAPLQFATQPPPANATLGKVHAVLASLPVVERATHECAPRLLVLERSDAAYTDENPRWQQIERAQGNLLVIWVVKTWKSTTSRDGSYTESSGDDYMGTLYACPDPTLAAIAKEAAR